MELHNLFKAVVLGGSVLAGGCGASAASGARRASVEPEPQAAPLNPDRGAPAGAVRGADAARLSAQCASVCDQSSTGPETFCPDPGNKNIKNCCWLMVRRHPCCPK